MTITNSARIKDIGYQMARKTLKNGKKPSLEELKEHLRQMPLDIDTVQIWCKCFFHIRRVNPARLRYFQPVFIVKIKEIDSNDTPLIAALKERCCDPTIKRAIKSKENKDNK